MQTEYKLSLPPKPGQAMLYVELTLVENMAIADCLALLVERGYQPELRYRQWRDSEGNSLTGLFAVLKDEHHDPAWLEASEYLADERDQLAELIKPDLAVRCPRGRTKRLAIAA
jgi:hypothetical protein